MVASQSQTTVFYASHERKSWERNGKKLMSVFTG